MQILAGCGGFVLNFKKEFAMKVTEVNIFYKQLRNAQ